MACSLLGGLSIQLMSSTREKLALLNNTTNIPCLDIMYVCTLNKHHYTVDMFFINSLCLYKVNGNLTLGENIADNGGVKTAYQAFKTVTKDKKIPSLPGVDLSSDELFFVAFGQVIFYNTAILF